MGPGTEFCFGPVGALLRGAVGTRGGFVAGAAAFIATAAGGSVAAAEELEVFYYHGHSAAFAAALLVFPGVEFEASLDEEGAAFSAVLVDDFGLAAEGGAVHEADFFAVFALGGAEFAVHRQAKLDDGGLAGEIFELGIAGEISQEKDTVKAGHRTSGG